MDAYDLAALVVAVGLIAVVTGWVALTSATCSAFMDRDPVDLDVEDMAHRHDDWIPTKYQP